MRKLFGANLILITSKQKGRNINAVLNQLFLLTYWW